MWRVGLALYAKAGGVPWKLSDTDPETAYIGISSAVRPPSRSAQLSVRVYLYEPERRKGVRVVMADLNDQPNGTFANAVGSSTRIGLRA
jgi:hypothetical protein